MTTTLSCMGFAAISGSGSACAGAIGSIMIPPMVKKGYHRGFAVSIVASGSVIGPIIPPSINMILWCSITGVSIGALFMSGVVPGVLMGISLMVCTYVYAKKNPHIDEGTYGVRIPVSVLLKTIREASFAMLVPFVIIGGIVGGIFTATEAAAVAIFLSLFAGIFLYKELDTSKMLKYLTDTAMTTASIMLVIGFAMTIGWALSISRFSETITAGVTTLTTNPTIFLMLLIALFTFLGTFMSTPELIMIFAPILHPMCAVYGIHPVHLGLVVIMTCMTGGLTPPVGNLLYIATGIAQIRLVESLKFIWPMVIALTIATLITAFVPRFALFLPSLLGLI